MDEQDVQQNNMISNLPLIFANGYPTSLDKITETQLENFIPFMVQCSLGHINVQGKIDYSEPEWWPENVQFNIPFSKPKKFSGNWKEKMKEIVIICYQFHKSVFLLRFCNDLAAYEHASLRFINNYNSTTSLFDRRSNKLLVTFRNENMSYDQPQRSRKCLLQQKSKNGPQIDQDLLQMMVEPAPFDIYLCDNCDAELYSKDAILEHEKTCNMEDDVILCDTPEPAEDINLTDNKKNNEINELRIGFLLNFNLQIREDFKNSIRTECPPQESFDYSAISKCASLPQKDENKFTIIDKSKRMPRRNRAVHSLARCPMIPLSSPAGKLLVRSTKSVITEDYLNERLDRIERFCHAPTLSKSLTKQKYFDRKYSSNNVHCTFKKPQEYSTHIYVFPRRQFSQKRRAENIMFLNSTLIKKCRPISVRLKKISDKEITRKKATQNLNLNIKLTRDTTRSSNWKISSSPSTEIIVDTIDLCSSDDEINENRKESICYSLNSVKKSTIQSFCLTKTLHIDSVSTIYRKDGKPRHKNQKETHEVTLTPIKNQCGSVKSDKCITSSSSMNTCTIPSTQDSLRSNKDCALYEDTNLITSSVICTENGMTQPKPLQPSVFIFSNYMTSPLGMVSTTSNEFPCTADLQDNSNINRQNQENHLTNNLTSSNNGSKKNASTPLSTSTGTVERLPHSNKIYCNNIRSMSGSSTISNITHSRVVDRECTSKSVPLIQCFESPSRVISIDLTS